MNGTIVNDKVFSTWQLQKKDQKSLYLKQKAYVALFFLFGIFNYVFSLLLFFVENVNRMSV